MENLVMYDVKAQSEILAELIREGLTLEAKQQLKWLETIAPDYIFN